MAGVAFGTELTFPHHQSVRAALSHNRALQAILTELLKEFSFHHEQILGRLILLRHLRTHKLESESRVNAKQFQPLPVSVYLPPYFRDLRGCASPSQFRNDLIDPLAKPPIVRWTRQEDEFLVTAVDVVRKSTDDGSIDWNTVAASLLCKSNRRSPFECCQRYNLRLCPSSTLSAIELPFSSTESAAIKSLHESGYSWDTIANAVGNNRLAYDCFELFVTKIINRAPRKWSATEDEILKYLVSEFQFSDRIPWDSVACFLDGRTATQCSVRWTRSVDPNIKRTLWTLTEDLMLATGVSEYGFKEWSRISKHLPGRTDSQCRLRWRDYLDESTRKYKHVPHLIDFSERFEQLGLGQLPSRLHPQAHEINGKRKQSESSITVLKRVKKEAEEFF